MRPPPSLHRQDGERGAALVIALIVFLGLATLAYSFATITSSAHRENARAVEDLKTFYTAEAALSEAFAVLRIQGTGALAALATPQVQKEATFWVDTTLGTVDPILDDDLVRLVATSQRAGQTRSVEMVVRLGNAGGKYVFGMFGRERVSLFDDASIDSYDSTLGAWAAQVSGTINGIGFAVQDAPVRSNGDIVLDSNCVVFGDAEPGPGDSVSTSGAAQVTGSTIPALQNLALPAITLPSISGPGGSYFLQNDSQTLVSGDYEFTSFTLDEDAELLIQGPARILVADFTVTENARIDVDASGGAVEFYVTDDFYQGGSSYARPISGDPADLQLFVAGVGTDVDFSSTAEFTGIVYAPDRWLHFWSSSKIFGACTADRMSLVSDAGLHYDVNLGVGGFSSGNGSAPVILSWRPVATPVP